ncbi:MAG: transporter substrate-binding domain-containing protein [Rubrivivax sp.]
MSAAVAAGAGLWSLLPDDDDSLARVRAAGVLRVGFAIEPPYALALPDGTISGESPDVARAVARRIGVDTRWILTDFESLIDELEKGRFDLVAAGLFINAERAQRVAFSRPTLRVRAGWLARAGQAPDGLSYAGPPAGFGHRVAVLAGSVEQHALARSSWPPGAVMVVPDAASGRTAVASGEVLALALSWPSVSRAAQSSGGRLVALPAQGGRVEQVALAVRRDDRRLLRAVDETLAGFIGSAEHLALLQRHGLGAQDLPEARDGAH